MAEIAGVLDGITNPERIYYTRYVTTMLAGRDGNQFDTIQSLPGTNESFPSMGNPNSPIESSLKKRWKQAASLEGYGTSQSDPDYYDTETPVISKDRWNSEIQPSADDAISGQSNQGGPYKLGDFHGFSHVSLNIVYDNFPNQNDIIQVTANNLTETGQLAESPDYRINVWQEISDDDDPLHLSKNGQMLKKDANDNYLNNQIIGSADSEVHLGAGIDEWNVIEEDKY